MGAKESRGMPVIPAGKRSGESGVRPPLKVREESLGLIEPGLPNSYLLSFGEYLSQRCSREITGFNTCRFTHPNPSKCFDESVEVRECYHRETLPPLEKCPKEALEYTDCIEANDENYMLCYAERKVFSKCLRDKIDPELKFLEQPAHPRWDRMLPAKKFKGGL